MPSSLRLIVLAACALASGVAAAGEAPRADAPPGPGRWHTITVPVTAERLSAAVDLPPPALPENLLFGLVRVLHERPLRREDFARGRARPALELLRGTPPPPGADDNGAPTTVPLPLAPETWTNVILKRRVEPHALAGAILADRRAALLYVGLSQLDAGTLTAIERMPAVLWSLDERQASAFAAFGGSLAIDDGEVRLPGPPATAPAWAALAGAPHTDPARFLPALLARDRGRLAYFFDALTRLDEAHRRFALGGESAAGAPGLASLYEVFRRVSPEWDVSLFPFYHPAFDPATMLAALDVTDEGRLAPPWPREVWERVFSGRTEASAATGSNGGTVEAAWLLSAVLAQGPKIAATRAAEVAFAGRAFGGADVAGDPLLVPAIAGYGRYPALMATLEGLGVTRPATYADAARVAGALTRHGSPTALAVFQTSLALIAGSAWARGLDPLEADRLAGSLIALDASGDRYEARVAGWLSAVLLPSLAEATGSGDGDDAEAIVLRGLAGVRAAAGAGSRPLIDWYGRHYAVDAAAGALARFPAIRERQGPPTLDEALAFGDAIDALEGDAGRQASSAALSARLEDLVAALPDIDQNRRLRQTLDRARARLAAPPVAPAIAIEARRDLAAARAEILADALTALAYVHALGDPNGPARLGGHVARRHVFAPVPDLAGDGAEPAWRLPHEAVTTDRGWHVEGALLGVGAALARLALRRLDVDVIPVAPRIDDTTRRQFMLDAALTRPFDYGDADRDLIAEGLAAGRARVRRLLASPDALDGIASAAGLGARRAQGIAWAMAEGESDATSRFSLAELLRLGAGGPLPFGVTTVPAGACPRGVAACPREASDLVLRLAEELATRRLPAALLPGLLGPATQDFVDQVQPLYAGDLDALWTWVAGLPSRRVDDYVAALEGSGALRPVTGSGTEGVRWREPEF